MFSKFIVSALCASASFQAVAAANHHRHLHGLAKKDIEYAATEVVVLTEYVTKTVMEGEEEATPTPTIQAVYAGKRPSKRPSKSPSTSVEITSTSAAPVVEPTTYEPEPTSSVEILAVETPSPTTMVTSVAPVAVPTEVQPIVEVATEKIAEVTSAVAAAVTSIVAAIPTPTTVASSGGVKRGIAYNSASLASSVIAAAGGKFGWAYNWGATSGGLTASVPFYPTCWSPGKSQGWAANAAAAIKNGADALFSFNEADIASQANMSPSVAAEQHIALMVPFKGQARISAPSISSSQNANQGVDWLKQFFTACAGNCAIDFCNAHWYGPGGKAGGDEFLGHLVNVQSACQGKNVWVTEFKAEDSAENEAAFIKYVLNELDTNSKYSFVEKYSYFYMNDGFLTTGNTLNALGQIYATL